MKTARTASKARVVRSKLLPAALAIAALAAASAAHAGTWAYSSYTNAYGTRSYQVWIPTGYTPGQSVPLVVALHGCGQTPADWAGLTRINTLADSQKFMVLYPAQSTAANPSRCWNWFLPANQSRGVGEPSIIKGMVDAVKAFYTINNAKVYVFGLSAGGAMTSIMSNCYSDVFAAAGTGAGVMYKGVISASQNLTNGSPYDPRERGYDGWVCGVNPTARKVPTIVFQGSADTTVTPINADQLVTQIAQMNDLGDNGLNDAGIKNVPTSTTSGSAGGRSYTLKKYNYGSTDVIHYYTVSGMGHTWSGGDPAYSAVDPSGPDATTLMWNFLKLYSR